MTSSILSRSGPMRVSPRAQAWLTYIIIAVLLVLTAYYVVPYVFTLSEPVQSLEEQTMKVTPRKLEEENNEANIAGDIKNMASVENFTDESSTVKELKEAINKLAEDDQNRVCASVNSLVNGYRSLFSGAAFKFTESSKGSGEFFLLGPDMRVVQVAGDGTGSLSLEIKNESPLLQLFKREVATKDNMGKDIATGGETCYVFTPKNSPDMALQYEHEHLSLRPIARSTEGNNPMPFMGQCFLRFRATEEELNARTLATGLAIPSLGARHLQPTARGGEMVRQGFRTNTELERMTREREEKARTPAVRDYAEYQNKTGGPQMEVGQQGNPFANNPIQLNIDLASVIGRDGFQDNDARNPESGGTSVRALLDKYTKEASGDNATGTTHVSDKDMAINKAYHSAMNGNANAFGGTSALGCPSIDRSKYYTERQLAQCAGCTPDSFMRGAGRV